MSFIILLPEWRNTLATVFEDSNDKKAEEHTNQENFTDFEEEWIMFESRGAQRKKNSPPIMIWNQGKIEQRTKLISMYPLLDTSGKKRDRKKKNQWNLRTYQFRYGCLAHALRIPSDYFKQFRRRGRGIRMVLHCNMLVVCIDFNSCQVQVRQSNDDKEHTIISSFWQSNKQKSQ